MCPLLRGLADLGFIGVAIDARFHGERRSAPTHRRRVDRFSFILEREAAHEVTPEAAKATLDWLARWLTPTTR